MPKRITDRPIQPKRRRRGGFNLLTYEAAFIVLWVVGIIGAIFMFGRWPHEWGWFSDADADSTVKWILGFVGLVTFVLFRFDKLSVIREKESFAFLMKEYEMLRSKWLDAEAKRMDAENQEASSESEPKSKVATNIISSGGIIVATPEEAGIPVNDVSSEPIESE